MGYEMQHRVVPPMNELLKSISDGARRKCPWGARRSGFSGTRQYVWYAEFLKNRCNAVDGTFYDAIKLMADWSGKHQNIQIWFQ